MGRTTPNDITGDSQDRKEQAQNVHSGRATSSVVQDQIDSVSQLAGLTPIQGRFQQQGDPTTDDLDQGEAMVFNSDGSGTGSAGSLIYAVNDGGTIKTSIIAQKTNAT